MNEQIGLDGPAALKDGDAPTVSPIARVGRRALVLGAAAAGAGMAASLVVGNGPAEAENNSPVLLGDANTATATTSITNNAGGAFDATTSANGGHSAVHGNDTSAKGGYGVAGSSANGTGVSGMSTYGPGVYGTTSGNGQAGVAGVDGALMALTASLASHGSALVSTATGRPAPTAFSASPVSVLASREAPRAAPACMPPAQMATRCR
jgi:hypothetical protein